MSSGKGLLQGGLWINQTPSVYSLEQARQWLEKIGYPGDLASFKPSLDNLSLLARLSLTTFPFESTPMHYTAEHSMDISFEGVYERLVVSSGGAGSYCFGLNGLFFQMIKGLGLRVYVGAGRINEQGPGAEPVFHAFVHQVIFVQPTAGSNETYLVDVAAGPVRPILLAEGEVVDGASPTEHHRLTRTARADSSLVGPNALSAPKLEWRLESLHSAKKAAIAPTTRVLYSFIEDEFFPEDFRAANGHVLRLKTGLFWENVVCTKFFFLSDDEVRSVDADADPDHMTPLTRYLGRVAMAGRAVRRHVGTQTTVLREMRTEAERAAALEEFLGIRIAQEDLRHIRGRGAALEAS